MRYTENYNLKKPEELDPVDIQDLNYNADVIDSKLKEVEDWEAAHLQASNPHSITPALIGAETPAGAQAKVNAHEQKAAPHSGHETPSGAQAKANAALAEAKLYAENVATNSANSALNSAKDYADEKANQAETNAKSYADQVASDLSNQAETNAKSYADQVASDLSQKVDETRIKVLGVEQDVSNISKVLTSLNPNQEATQSVSGYGIVSLPKNAANGQFSDVVVKGLTVTNLIKNGNFEEGLNNWLNYGTDSTGSIREESTEYAFLGNTSFKLVRSLGTSGGYGKRQLINTIPNHKYYAYGWCYIPSEVDVNAPCALIIENPNTVSYFKLDLKDVWQRTSLEFIASLNSTTFILSSITGLDKTAAGYFDGIVCIDLTSTFGAGNEPTKEQCDKIFTNWFDGTKSTISAMRIKSIGKNIINLDAAKPNSKVNSIRFYDDRIVVYPSGIDCSIRIPFYMEAGKAYRGKLLPRGAMFFGSRTWFVDNINRISNTSSNPIIPLINIKGAATWFLDNREELTPITIYKEDVMIALSTTIPEYEPYKESIAYINGAGELRSLPNGVKDEVNVTEGTKVQNVSNDYALKEIDFKLLNDFEDYQLIAFSIPESASNTPSLVNKYRVNGWGTATGQSAANIGCVVPYSSSAYRLAFVVAPNTYADLAEARTALVGTTLNYQLATPIEIPIQTSGSLVSYPSGTVYIEPYVADAGIYTDKMTVLHQDLPIKALEKLSKIDFTTGLETELDVSDAIIAEDKLSFTHPDLVDGDIVFFTYEYDRESTEGETEIEYYDSRYVIKDSVTEKFYKWHIAVADGVPSIELVEV